MNLLKKVSIIMLAYNKLEYTKLAVDSLYKYTSHIDFDFISVNNGSSDGTKEYFQALPNNKKINFEVNVGGDKAFNEALKYCDGKYTVFLNNDLILTQNWLDNLINVMESEPKAGIVVPACNSSSNYQVICADYTNTDELDKFAKEYNKPDCSKWEERIRLMMYVALFRTEELKAIGGLDEAYSPGGFDDDDLSFRYRRAGYKLIFAKDTYVHHYGSITIQDEYAKILGRNREIFKAKFGVDSWEAMTIDFRILNNIKYIKEKKINILGIGNTCAATALQMKNLLKERNNSEVNLSYYALDKKYIIDLKTICNNVFYDKENTLDFSSIKDKFDYIYLDKSIEKIENTEEILLSLKKLLKDSGTLIFTFREIKASDFDIKNKVSNEFVLISFTKDNLDNILKTHGYKTISEKFEDGDYIYIIEN